MEIETSTEKIDRLEELFKELNRVIVEELIPNVEASYKLFNTEIEKIKQKIDNIESKQTNIDGEIGNKINELKVYVESEIEKTKKSFYEELEKLRAETKDTLYEYATIVNSKLEEIKEVVKGLKSNVDKSKISLLNEKNFDLTWGYEADEKDTEIKSPRLL